MFFSICQQKFLETSQTKKCWKLCHLVFKHGCILFCVIYETKVIYASTSSFFKFWRFLPKNANVSKILVLFVQIKNWKKKRFSIPHEFHSKTVNLVEWSPPGALLCIFFNQNKDPIHQSLWLKFQKSPLYVVSEFCHTHTVLRDPTIWLYGWTLLVF